MKTPQDQLFSFIREKKDITNLINSKSINIEARDPSDDNATAIIIAAMADNFAAVKILLQNGANPKAKDDEGYTALHWAAHNNNMKSLEALLEAGAKIDTINDGGSTPLHWACMLNATSAIDFLIKKGARQDIKDVDGKLASERNLSASETHQILITKSPLLLKKQQSPKNSSQIELTLQEEETRKKFATLHSQLSSSPTFNFNFSSEQHMGFPTENLNLTPEQKGPYDNSHK